jgi:hypothetical protein
LCFGLVIDNIANYIDLLNLEVWVLEAEQLKKELGETIKMQKRTLEAHEHTEAEQERAIAAQEQLKSRMLEMRGKNKYLLASVALHGIGLMVGVGVIMNSVMLAGFSASAYCLCISASAAGINFLAVAGAVYATKAYAPQLASTFLMAAQNIEGAGLVLIMSTSLAISVCCIMETQESYKMGLTS